MIFVMTGSQKFQFDRLLYKLDCLIKEDKIKDKVVGQIGYSEYEPKNFNFYRFLDKDELINMIKKSDLIITHAGTGSIINALKLNKKVIGIPRLKKYGEHVDDHQIEIIKQFEKSNLIMACYEIDNLGDCIKKIKDLNFMIYKSNTEKYIEEIRKFIQEEKK